MSPTHGKAHGAHPSAERLLDYHRGRLESADHQALEDHLADCPECTRIVLDLAGRHRAEDRKLDASWSALRPRLERGPAAVAGRRLWVVLAASILAVAALAAWGFVHQQRQIRAAEARVAELERLLAGWSQPQTVVPGIDLLPAGAVRRTTSPPVLDVPADARFLVFRLTLLAPTADDAFDLGIFDRDERLVSRLSGVRRDERGIVTVALPRAFMGEGTYRLRLYDSGTDEPEAEFAVGLRYPEP